MNLIIVFPKIEHAKSVRSILQKGGYTVDAVCCTGAQALQAAGHLDSGIIICAYRLPDMVYSELHEYLAPRYDMLLIGSGSQIAERVTADIVGLSTPLKVFELLQSVEIRSGQQARKKNTIKRPPGTRTAEEKHAIAEAKVLLMERNHLSEEEAHRYLQKRSMDNSTGMLETAQMIISLMGRGM